MIPKDKGGSLFFDVHMHAMDLSHPNLLAFVARLGSIAPKLVLAGIAEPFVKEEEKKILNLLAIMENSIEDFFILAEYFLKNRTPVVGANNVIQVGESTFNTMLITPLIMDFGYKNIKTATFYDMALGKPVVDQTTDILNAIKKYCTCEFAVKEGTGTQVEGTTVPRVSRPLFEIYPFMGINTENYDIASLQELLDRCFSGYTGNWNDLHANMGAFDGAIEKVGSNVFAGIKVYPPLGFDPWPEGNDDEMDKVEVLYKVCEEKRIPITSHCSDGGFVIDPNAKDKTNPEKWRKVLGQYPSLKLDLAHFGHQGDFVGFIHRHKWRETVVDLILSHDNVYTDIACLAFDDGFYRDLNQFLSGCDTEKRTRLTEKILFGSDFMINLLWANSYNEYLDLFLTTDKITDTEKIQFCNRNSAKFLFG